MFNAHIVTISDKILYNGKAHSVMMPGVEGEFEVVDLHGPIAALLAPGVITIVTGKKEPWQEVIEQGVVRFDGKELFAVVE